jgi:hypothetical protein
MIIPYLSIGWTIFEKTIQKTPQYAQASTISYIIRRQTEVRQMSNEKERDRISFRLRNVDVDLRQATKDLTGDKVSDLARDGLRLILGIRTTKRVELTERTIVAKMLDQPQAVRAIQSKPAVYIPNQRR